MFNILTRRKTSPAGLLTSKLFDEKLFYEAFIRDLKKCQVEAIIESPYMTVRRTNELLPILRKLVKRGVKVTIHTRHPRDHEELRRIQAWIVLKSLRPAGIKVRFFTDHHHRKIAVLDGRILWEGSLNILSQGNSREIMRRIESEQLARQMISFLRLKRYYW